MTDWTIEGCAKLGISAEVAAERAAASPDRAAGIDEWEQWYIPQYLRSHHYICMLRDRAMAADAREEHPIMGHSRVEAILAHMARSAAYLMAGGPEEYLEALKTKQTHVVLHVALTLMHPFNDTSKWTDYDRDVFADVRAACGMPPLMMSPATRT